MKTLSKLIGGLLESVLDSLGLGIATTIDVEMLFWIKQVFGIGRLDKSSKVFRHIWF